MASANDELRGLSEAAARERLERDGPNELPRPRGPSAARQLFGQLTHFFARLLWAAGALAVVAGMPALGIAIFVIIVVNGVVAFAQEHRAERTAEAIGRMLPSRTVVRREGRRRSIDARELVVGDVVVLAAGDRVTADVRLVEVHGLALDASMLTGESAAVRPGRGEDALAGTWVVEGEALGEVRATGPRTRLAGIARLTERGHHGDTPLAREIERLVRLVAVIALAVGAVFFAVGVVVGLPARDGLLFAIGVTVALVPEGLLPTVTLSLALGARRMASRHALVRRLDAVEGLGAATFVCTDKTGTLTENRMQVVRAWTPRGTCRIRGEGYAPSAEIDVAESARPALVEMARAGARCSSGHARQHDGEWIAEGDPMEAALDVLARRLGIDLEEDARRAPARARFPFDPRRRRMSIVAGDELLVKGAVDAVLPRCRDAGEAASVARELGRTGLRVLAIARRSAPEVAAGSAEAIETDLELLGVVGLEDPPRAGAAEALAACRRAGIRVAMITGDHATTAEAIAREVGLAVEGGEVLAGPELPADDASLGAALDRDGTVVCRVSPEDKLRIARALQARGHVVAMTGDGVNDGPALRQADVGVAMGRSGTDVAREAADLVLLDDHFATIVTAIAHGRATFHNLRRALGYHMTDNVAELTPFVLWALSGGRFPLAIGVLQILCLDLLTDQLPALAIGAQRPPREDPGRSIEGRHLVDRGVLVRSLLVAGPVEAVAAMLAFASVLWAGGWHVGGAASATLVAQGSGAAFVAIVAGQLGNALALRQPDAGARRAFAAAGLFAIVVSVVLLATPPLARLLGHAIPPAPSLLVALLAAPVVWLATRISSRGLSRGHPERGAPVRARRRHAHP